MWLFLSSTPLKRGKPDLSDIVEAWQQIKYLIKPGQLIVIESSLPRLHRRNFTII